VSNWPRVPLGDLVVEERPQRRESDEPVWNLNLDQIEPDTGRVLERVRVPQDDLGPSTYPFAAGTVLYSKLRPYLNKVVVADEPGFATTELVPLRCKPQKAVPDYIAYFLRSAEFLSFATTVVAGAKMPRMVMSEFWKYQVPLPPLDEQRRIAAILDKADALRTKRREALVQLDRLAQSIFVEMFGDPVTNSKGWNLLSLQEATDFQEGPGILAKDFRAEGIPLVRLAGMGGSEVSLRGCNFVDPEMFARKWSHFALKEGDILVLTSATFGNPTVVGKEAVGALFYTGIIRFRPRRSDVDPTYLRQYLASPWFLRQATALASGAVIKHFGPTHLRQMTIPVPPLQLQTQFVARTVALESLRIQAKAASAAVEQLFTSIQQQAFIGGL
jgi:type I restriction enzyme, S subunit